GNLMAVSSAMGSPQRIVQGCVDQTVDELLGLQEEEEATICLSPVGPEGHRFTDRQLKRIDPILPKVQPLSVEETKYAGIWEAHRASVLKGKQEIDNRAKVRLDTTSSQLTTQPRTPYPPPV